MLKIECKQTIQKLKTKYFINNFDFKISEFLEDQL